eukprot:g4011.t1
MSKSHAVHAKLSSDLGPAWDSDNSGSVGSAEHGENNGKSVRRSTREKKSRFVTLQGHRVLKANNYSLESGISTFTGTDLQKKIRKVRKTPPAKSAYSFFLNHQRYLYWEVLKMKLSGGQHVENLLLKWCTDPQSKHSADEPVMKHVLSIVAKKKNNIKRFGDFSRVTLLHYIKECSQYLDFATTVATIWKTDITEKQKVLFYAAAEEDKERFAKAEKEREARVHAIIENHYNGWDAEGASSKKKKKKKKKKQKRKEDWNTNDEIEGRHRKKKREQMSERLKFPSWAYNNPLVDIKKTKSDSRTKTVKKQTNSARRSCVKNTKQMRFTTRNEFLSKHLKVLEPFVPSKVLKKLSVDNHSSSSGSLSSAGSSNDVLCTTGVSTGGPLDIPRFSESPQWVQNATLRDYQLKGLNFFLKMHALGMPSILADEMGLGKTIQTISFLTYIHEINPEYGVVRSKNVNLNNHQKAPSAGKKNNVTTTLVNTKHHTRPNTANPYPNNANPYPNKPPSLVAKRGSPLGPSLCVVPLSVITSWINELKRFSPNLRVLRFHSGSQDERERLKKLISENIDTLDVVVTTFEMVTAKESCLRRAQWNYLVVDEGHKLKNEKSGISQTMQSMRATGKILLTGTPLQNNLHELWALLHFLCPDIFADSEPFDAAFDLTRNIVDDTVLAKANVLLKLFQMRRVKSEVEVSLPAKHEVKLFVGLSPMQKFWAQKLLQRDANLLAQVEANLRGTGLDHEKSTNTAAGSDGVEDESITNEWKKLNNLLMQLRKVVCHPYLLPGAELNWDGESTGEDIVEASAKMKLLDKLLKALYEGGHRVVLFTQFTNMLNILEDYIIMRGWNYCRLDGSTPRSRRAFDIRVFNAANSKKFIYLMSTRAGGLGINCQTADTVILYDSDWNPQVDLQAQARVHRIGQKNKVHAYRLVTQGSVEERILQRAEKKLYLDKMVNTSSNEQEREMEKLGKEEMLKMLKFGAHAVFSGSDSGLSYSDEDVLNIIDRKQNYENTQLDCSSYEKEDIALSIRDMKGFSSEETKAKACQSVSEIAKAWSNKKRERKATTVIIDGYAVKTENLESKIKTDGTPDSKNRTSPPKNRNRLMAGRDYEHGNSCIICWDGGELLCCDCCSVVAHRDCLEARGFMAEQSTYGPNSSATTFRCPHHQCGKCGRTAGVAGGCLLRCTECPTALCEDCEDPNTSYLEHGRCMRFEACGMPQPKEAYYFQCSHVCRQFYLHRIKYGIESAIRAHSGSDAEFKDCSIDDERNDVESESKGTSLTSKLLTYPNRVVTPPVCKQLSGCIVDYDGCRWCIANEDDTCLTIADWTGLNIDGRRLHFCNR